LFSMSMVFVDTWWWPARPEALASMAMATVWSSSCRCSAWDALSDFGAGLAGLGRDGRGRGRPCAAACSCPGHVAVIVALFTISIACCWRWARIRPRSQAKRFLLASRGHSRHARLCHHAPAHRGVSTPIRPSWWQPARRCSTWVWTWPGLRMWGFRVSSWWERASRPHRPAGSCSSACWPMSAGIRATGSTAWAPRLRTVATPCGDHPRRPASRGSSWRDCLSAAPPGDGVIGCMRRLRTRSRSTRRRSPSWCSGHLVRGAIRVSRARGATTRRASAWPARPAHPALGAQSLAAAASC